MRLLLRLGGLVALRFHRLAEPITFAIHLNDLALVRQVIEQCGRHPLARNDRAPFAKRQWLVIRKLRRS